MHGQCISLSSECKSVGASTGRYLSLCMYWLVGCLPSHFIVLEAWIPWVGGWIESDGRIKAMSISADNPMPVGLGRKMCVTP